MLIKNARVFMPNGRFVEGAVRFSETIEEIIEGKYKGQENAYDAGGRYLIPGLVDVHTHGALGEDASDGSFEGLRTMAEYYASHGVTSWCPTTMTLKEPELLKAMAAVREYSEWYQSTEQPARQMDDVLSPDRSGEERVPEDGRRVNACARCVGIHLEGPFLSYERRGAQNADNLMKPDLELVRRLDDASGGLVKLITVAPEIEGAEAFIRSASESYTISIGHTAADYDTAVAGFEAGADHATHLFNGMNPMQSREPGVPAAALDCGAKAELIVDGLHIHPAVVRMVFHMLPTRVNLISDSIRCTGMPDGEYELGGQMVTLANGKATLKGTNTLAGSTMNLLDCVKNAVAFDIPLQIAVWSATRIPAEQIGLEDSIGILKPGNFADFLLLDKELNLTEVYIGGERAY